MNARNWASAVKVNGEGKYLEYKVDEFPLRRGAEQALEITHAPVCIL